MKVLILDIGNTHTKCYVFEVTSAIPDQKKGGSMNRTLERTTMIVIALLLSKGWADIIQLGASYQCLNGGSLPPKFVLELQAQDIAFINCQIFCTLEKDAAPNLRREALTFSVVNSPVVDLSLIGMHTRNQIVENISVIDSIFNHENHTV